MESSEFWTIRGNDLLDQEKFEDSLIAYNLSLKIDPRNKSAMVGRGGIIRGSGQAQGSIESL